MFVRTSSGFVLVSLAAPAAVRGLAVRGPLLQRACVPATSTRRSFVVASVNATEPEASVVPSTSAADAIGAVYRFSRPHTIRGTLLACATGVGRALLEAPEFVPLLPAMLPRAMIGVLTLLLGNLFIVGINQIYDVDIDVVNKPFLPMAAGEMSPTFAWSVVAGSLALGLGLVRSFFSPLIFRLYSFGMVVGALYSVPSFHLKRFPLAAGITIATCRGFLLNFGVYHATREALGQAFLWNPAVSFLARFMVVYASVIAVTKDLPDIEGDRKGGIDTFASRMGPAKVAKGATAVLLLNYLGAIATPLLAAQGAFRSGLMVGGHALAAAWLVKSWRALDASSVASIKTFYGQIWNLFYFEYLMYPFI